MLADMTLETFSPHCESDFRVVLPDGAVNLLLVEVQGPSVTGAQQTGRPFSLLFRGPAGLALEQRTYGIEHAVLGAFDVFLVPLQPDGEGSYFEAVFN